MGIIMYNGVSSEDLGLVIQTPPLYNFSEKDLEFSHVQGRNGDVISYNNCYKNTTRTYYLAKVFRRGETFADSAENLIQWLHSANTYVRLEDSYDPDVYRMAIFKNDGSFPNHYDLATTIEASFDCKPQRWLKSGDVPIDIPISASVNNPTHYDAIPTIEFDVAANTSVTITIGTNIMQLDPIPSADHIIIDCENMECYSATSNYNRYLVLTSGEFPTLAKSATTTITVAGCTNATIKPRWWTL